MPQLLKIDVSPRREQSISWQLGADWLRRWQEKHPGATVVTRDLTADPLPYVDLPWVQGAFTPPDRHTDEHKAALRISDELVAELLAADEILITTPFYNFQAPAALKAWIDHIVRLDKTFSSSYQGLAGGRKVTVIVAAGGTYSPGSGMESMDYLSPWLKFIFGFIGITDVHIHFGYGTGALLRGGGSVPEYLQQNAVPLD